MVKLSKNSFFDNSTIFLALFSQKHIKILFLRLFLQPHFGIFKNLILKAPLN
jgi:hypothetical protein